VGDCYFIFLFEVGGHACNEVPRHLVNTPGKLRSLISLPQGSVQIELIFRLLLKITVDWP